MAESTGPTEGTQSPDSRKPFPQVNSFRNFVVEELNRRKVSYPAPMASPFVRLTSTKMDPAYAYAFFTLGLHGFNPDDLNIFDVSYGNGRDIVGYAYDLNSKKNGKLQTRLISTDMLSAGHLPESVTQTLTTEAIQRIESEKIGQSETTKAVFAKGTHPIPGVTSVNVQRRGLGTPQVATVKWVCYNRAQLEFLRNHFLIVGGYVVLEWGQQFADKTLNKTLDFSSDIAVRQELVNTVNHGRSHVIHNWVEPNDGNYDFMVGFVGNFQVSIDAKTNTYECSTTIYSVGEQLWGLNSHYTYFNKKDPSTPEGQQPSTFADFYRQGGAFDRIVEENGKYPNLVSQYTAKFSGMRAKASSWFGGSFDNYSQNPDDYRFISWECFTTVIIPNMMSMVGDEAIRTALTDFIKFYVNVQNKDEWVGDNPYLRSTDPDTMLIVRNSMLAQQGNADFAGAGAFDMHPEGKGFRGKLGMGVWLNVGMIRESFLKTNDFVTAVKSILEKMSAATGGFWSLQLYFDDDAGAYKVVDVKYTDGQELTKLYKFNQGVFGEMLDLDFDSAFPPELITQMGLFSQFQTADAPTQKSLLENFPAIGTTATYIFSLNWTALQDVVARDLRASRQNSGSVATLPPLVAPTGKEGAASANDRSIAHFAAGNPAILGPSVRTSPNTPAIGSALGTPAAINTDTLPSQKDMRIDAVRKSVAPIVNPKEAAILVNADKYKTLIDEAASDGGVDPDLVRAIVQKESGFVPNATRSEAHLSSTSYGLMQIVGTTARGLGYKEPLENLNDAKTNLKWGIKYLKVCLKESADLEGAIHQYNTGDHSRMTKDSLYTIDRSTKPPTTRMAKKGQFGNQPYVDSVMTYYNFFRTQSKLPPAPGPFKPTAVAQADVVDTSRATGPKPTPQDETLKRQQAEAETRKDNIASRFGKNIVEMFEPLPSVMINKITFHGYKNHPVPNAFVAPFPTSTTVGITTMGISGPSVSDGFFVDKLPFIFERHGCFQITEVTDILTAQGWRTKVVGIFKLLWLNGDGPKPAPYQVTI
jgi:soluble lytic murein transglycosylase-like protein/peptide methionine sulfoxide reductase MsrA